MDPTTELIPHLFRTEYRKITAVLTRIFGLEHLEVAEDIASDTFMLASETWATKGLPEHPVAWLYTVAKNKTKDYLKRNTVFNDKIVQHISREYTAQEAVEIDLSETNIIDAQLRMMFATCHPAIPPAAQISLSLRVLCGFGIEEIARAFLTSKEVVNKRLLRAKEKLREAKMSLELPGETALKDRLNIVLHTLYLLFNEGYHAASEDLSMKKDICMEAMRLNYLLVENPLTNLPQTYALLALMCFQSSRFEARTGSGGATVLYDNQDESQWDEDLIRKGAVLLDKATSGTTLSKYHLEAGIAYWHTKKEDSKAKWEGILQLYDQLLLLEYAPIAALNRTYVLAKVKGKAEGIAAAEKLDLKSYHLYHLLLGELYTGVNNETAINHFQKALTITKSAADQDIIRKKLQMLQA